jgi:hypothetical protein
MSAKFDRFTERARRTLTLAHEEATRFGHTAIGTEHLLLGLVREGDGIAARVLNNLGVQLPKVRAAVEATIGQGEAQPAGEIGLTPRAKRVMELAVDEARRLNHHYIGTEHLLLGLVREGEGIGARVLEGLGVSLEKLRAQTIQVLSQSGGIPPGSRPSFESLWAHDPTMPPDLRDALNQLRAMRQGLDEAISAQDFARATALRDRERELRARIERLEQEWRLARGSADDARPGPPDLARFTDGARRVLDLALEEAQRFNHTYIGTEHLLLGLTRDTGGVVARVLAELRVQLPKVRSAVEFIIGRSETMVMGEVGLTPRAVKSLWLADDEARQLGSDWVDTEHILIGLVREGEGIAAGVLESLGVNLGRLRVRVIQVRSAPAWQGGPMSPRHSLGARLRNVPAGLQGQRETLAIEVVVSLAGIEFYERGFVARITTRVVGPWPQPPSLAAHAEDDQGRHYEGHPQGSSGQNIEGGFGWRSEYHFTPALDTDAGSLTLTFSLIGRHMGAAVADEPAAIWTFTVPLPGDETTPTL